jgi:cytochrome c oxidase cbb3-type subunit 4
MILILFIVFYAYVYSIYKRDKTGERDFEKYSNLVHDDSIDSTPLEPIQGSKKDKENVV